MGSSSSHSFSQNSKLNNKSKPASLNNQRPSTFSSNTRSNNSPLPLQKPAISENADDRNSSKTACFVGPRASEITTEDVSKRRVNSQDAREKRSSGESKEAIELELSRRQKEIEHKLHQPIQQLIVEQQSCSERSYEQESDEFDSIPKRTIIEQPFNGVTRRASQVSQDCNELE